MLYGINRSDPWYADIVNFMVTGYVPLGGNKRKLIQESRSHIWDEPYHFQVSSDGLLRRCVPAEERIKIIERCHSSPCGGHYGVSRTHAKIWQCGFFWPIMYEDTGEFIRICGPCQRYGNVSSRDYMPLISNI